MESVFLAFARFGNSNSTANSITLSNADKWMKQAGIIDGKKITTTDTAICFSKFKSKSLNFVEFIAYVETLASERQIQADPHVFKRKLFSVTTPAPSRNVTQVDTTGVVGRLTDTSRFTGIHRERFDQFGKRRVAASYGDFEYSDGDEDEY